jgi:hypothetical protein
VNQKISPDYHQAICSSYLAREASVPELAARYEVSTSCIERILRLYHASRGNRTYDVDLHYFEQIDAPHKAYFLGLLFADGNNHTNVLRLSLQEQDSYLVEALKQEMSFDGPLITIKRKKDHHKLRVGVEICSTKLCRDLSALGCVPRKSLILRFPTDIPDRLMSHFCRGYFDGDGHVHIGKGSSSGLHVSITSSRPFCEGFRAFLMSRLGLVSSLCFYKHSAACSVKLTSRASIVFLDYLYRGAEVWMTRKFDKFISFLSSYSTQSTHGSKIPNKAIQEIKDWWMSREEQQRLLSQGTRRKDARSSLFGVERTRGMIAGVVCFDQQRIYVGQFVTEEAAARAYDVYCRRNGIDVLPLNYPHDATEYSYNIAEAGRLVSGSPKWRAKIGRANSKTEVERYGAEEAARRKTARAGKRVGTPRGPIIPVVINGIAYRSVNAAAKTLGMDAKTIKRRYLTSSPLTPREQQIAV